MDPIEALERAVYLLDRSAAPSFRVRAFSRAAGVLGALDPAEVARRAGAGSLTDLEHIGPVTAALVTEALAGGVPAYLQELEGRTAVACTTPGGAALRDALRGDCHTHSRWSDGGATIEAMATAAAALGHEYLVLTDHSPRLTVAHGLDRDRLLAQLDEVAEVNERLAPFRVLTGIEVDILPDGSLDQDEDLLGRLDVVVASVHSHLRMDRDEMTRRMAVAVVNPHVDILGHCTGRLVNGKRPPSTFDAELVFTACADYGTAVEVNCRPERLDPPKELLRTAVELGCTFSIDTDAHAPGQLEWQPLGCDRAAECGVSAERVLNTRDAEGLIAAVAG